MDRAAARGGPRRSAGRCPPAASRSGAREERRIHAYVEEHCWSDRLGAWTRSAGSEELDASVLLAARGSFPSDEPDRLSSTVDAIRSGLGAGSGLLYRYSGMREQEGAFVACSFWAVEALARVGRVDEASELMDTMVGHGSDVGLLTEEIDPSSGEHLGNIPQALSHLALVNAADVVRHASA